jgi:hypothetical protein
MKFEWIVPVIVFVVWVLNQLLRNREVEEPVRPRPGNQGPNRGPTNDIDRFLQEIDRLRRKSAEERGETVERPAARPVPRARPVPQAVPRARPVPRSVESRPAERVPEVVVVEAATVLPAPPSAPAPPPAGAEVRTPQTDRARDRRVSPAIAMTSHLLRSPQALSAAIVLHEILGPPKCRRRR